MGRPILSPGKKLTGSGQLEWIEYYMSVKQFGWDWSGLKLYAKAGEEFVDVSVCKSAWGLNILCWKNTVT